MTQQEAVRDIGVDVTPPSDTCADDNCPFHGTLPVRGQIFEGNVTSTAADNTATVQWGYYNHVPKYERYERRNTKITVHNPSCINAEEGDTVTVAECRPLSKTKSAVIIQTHANNQEEA